MSGGPRRNDDGVLQRGGKSKTRERQSATEALLQLERNVLSPLAEMTLAPVTFSTTSTSISLVFHSCRVHICLRDKGPFGSGLSGLDLFFNSATRCNQNLSSKYPERTRTGRGPRCFLYFCFSHLQISTFVPLSLQSPVVLTHLLMS